MKAEYYFESHVTIEPVFDEKLEAAKLIAARHGFRVADLLMKKRAEDTEERSSRDTFMTGHATDYGNLVDRTVSVVNDLQFSGFKVWRYKLEDIKLDSRVNDVLELL